MPTAEIRRGSIADIESLRPLWLSMHHHHSAVMPELSPYVDDRETWEIRKAHYEGLLAKPDTVLVLATSNDAAVGYGLAHVMDASATWTSDTWRTDDRVGEI